MLRCRSSAVCRPSCVAVFVNMASHKSLTDDDLRKKLKEYGITSPVTATTRNILIKKLNHVIASQKKVSAASTRAKRASTASQLNTFSSDEDEDNDTSVHSQANRSFKFLRNRRESRGNTETVNNRNDSISSPQLSRTSGRQRRPSSGSNDSGMREEVCRGPSGGGVSVLARSDARSDAHSEGAHARTAYYPVSARSGISPRAKIHDDYDTGSDSDLADGEDAFDTSARKGPASYVWNNNRESEVLPNNNSYKSPTYQNHTTSVSCDRSFNVSDVAGRSRKVNSFLENGDYDRDCLEDDVSFLGVAESIVTHASPGNHEQVRVANGRHHSESSQILDHSQSDESTWHYSVPLLLLILLAVFFGVVGMLYVNMRMPLLPTLCSVPAMVHQAVANVPVPFLTSNEPERQAKNDVTPPLPQPLSLRISHHTTKAPLPPEPAPSHTSEIKFPVCTEKIKIDCLTVQEIGSVQPILGRLEDVLLPALHRHAGLYQCGDTPLKYIPVPEIKDLFHQQDFSQESSSSVEGINALGKLVEINSHWGLEAVRGEDNALLGLSLSSQPTYILCHIATAIYSFFYMVMGIITVILTAWLAFYCVRYHKRKAEEEKQQVYELIEQILEVLGGVGIPAGKDYVAVNHVRDSLISPRDRRVKKRLWEKAVQFIDHYESRVLREIQEVGGEDCEVWRWASGVPHSPGNSQAGDGGIGRPPAKMWQGPAFDNLGPHNVPNVSPTSCLKIRNMFDCDVEFGDSWPSRIQDSILEKCEGVCIVHIAVDRGSREGCVYLKCASLSEAGRAFRALHGWWYDGNLVTVKFLRDERYHQRFPSARHATRRLRPSNNKRLSLQVPTGQPEASKHT